MEDDRYADVSNSVTHRNATGNVSFKYSISPEMMEEAKQIARKMDQESELYEDDDNDNGSHLRRRTRTFRQHHNKISNLEIAIA